MTTEQRYRLAWRHAWGGRHDANLDCYYLSRRLTRALDQLDLATELVTQLRSEHRIHTQAVDPDGAVTRYCTCGLRDCASAELLGSHDA